MKFILGTKVNMTQVFDADGRVHPVTVIRTGPLVVTQVKTTDSKDGYNAIQVGFGERRSKRISQAVQGHVKGLTPENMGFATIKEFRIEDEDLASTPTFSVGDKIESTVFAEGDKVVVSAISKGKGFQGVVKRHGFHGGPRSHGQKHSEREPGSIGGAGRDGGRVAKGKRMAGRMGSDRITVKGLTVIKVLPESNEIMIRGAIPGRRGTLVEVVSLK